MSIVSQSTGVQLFSFLQNEALVAWYINIKVFVIFVQTVSGSTSTQHVRFINQRRSFGLELVQLVSRQCLQSAKYTTLHVSRPAWVWINKADCVRVQLTEPVDAKESRIWVEILDEWVDFLVNGFTGDAHLVQCQLPGASVHVSQSYGRLKVNARLWLVRNVVDPEQCLGLVVVKVVFGLVKVNQPKSYSVKIIFSNAI